jgi:hypothetical protein
VVAIPEISRKRIVIMMTARKMKSRSSTLKLWMKSSRHRGMAAMEYYFQAVVEMEVEAGFVAVL